MQYILPLIVVIIYLKWLLRYVQRQEYGGVCELDVLCGAAAFRHLRRFDFYRTEEDGESEVNG